MHASLGADEDLNRVISPLRKAKPALAIHVRGDCGFRVPRRYAFCEENELTYTFGLTSNPVLKRLTAELLQQAREDQAKQRRSARLGPIVFPQRGFVNHPGEAAEILKSHTTGRRRFALRAR